MSLNYLQAGDENEENHQKVITLMCILILSTFSKFTKQKLTTDSKNKVVVPFLRPDYFKNSVLITLVQLS